MKTNRRLLRSFTAIIASLAVALLTASTPAGAIKYTYQKLPINLFGSPCINDCGQIVGTYNNGSQYHAFLWTITGGLRDLGTLGGVESDAYGINNIGQVVGQASDSNNNYHPFIWTANDGMHGFPPGGTGRPYSINNLGQAGGFIASGSYSHAAYWTSSGNITDLGTFGGANSWAYGINDSGVVVGSAGLPGGIGQAFSWTEQGGMKNLGSLLGSYSGVARAINNNGQIVGTAGFSGYSRPFLLNPDGSVQTLGNNNGNADGINDCGQVIGDSGGRAFIWTLNDGISDLNSLTVNLPSGVTLQQATCINNLGQIVGAGSEGTFLLSPQVEVAKKIYGIFIGSEHEIPLSSGAIFRADLGAQLLQDKFRNLPGYDFNNSKPLTTKMADGGVKRSKALEAISYLKNNVLKPGDGLILYVCCHGVELKQELLPPIYALAIGMEGPIDIDKINQFPNDYITDSNIKEMLSGMDDIQKWVFIDSCHSGGFYNSIHSLTNAGLIASTTADLLAWGSDTGAGEKVVKGGLFTTALDTGLSSKDNGKLIMDGYHSDLNPDVVNPEDGIITFKEILDYLQDYNQKTDWVGTIVYELGFGDPAIFALDMWNPTGFRTPDFVGGFSTNRKDISPILFLLLD